MKLIQNIDVYAPQHLGKKDVLIINDKIVKIKDAGSICADGFLSEAEMINGESVSSTPVLKRRKSSAPIPFSSLSIRFITAVGVIKSASAAFVKLPARDTVRNVSTSGLRIGNMIETEYFLRILV